MEVVNEVMHNQFEASTPSSSSGKPPGILTFEDWFIQISDWFTQISDWFIQISDWFIQISDRFIQISD